MQSKLYNSIREQWFVGFFSKLPFFIITGCYGYGVWLPKWHEVELVSSKNPHFRHFCARNLLNDTKRWKNIQFFIYFRCQARPSRTEGRVLPELCHFLLLKWLVVRVRSPITVSRSSLYPYPFQAPAAQNSLVLDLLRQCLSLEIKKTIKAGSPLVYYRWTAHLHFSRQFCLYYTISSLPWSWVVLVLFWTNISKINLFSLSLWMVTRFPPFAWQICFACFQVLFSENFL